MINQLVTLREVSESMINSIYAECMRRGIDPATVKMSFRNGFGEEMLGGAFAPDALVRARDAFNASAPC